MVKFQLPQGTGIIKKSKKYKDLKPNQKIVYDKVYDPINGPLVFAENCCYVVRNGLEQYVPFDYQREMMFNMHNYHSLISLFSRQNGKTITTAIYLLWYAMAFEYKQILVTAQDLRAASENLGKIKGVYENCPNFLKRGVLEDNKSKMVFDNGSEIHVRPSTLKAPRGISPAIVYCDEFAFIGAQESGDKALEKQEEFYGALSPTLSATKGKLFITSTPISETDLFYRLWSGAIKKVDDYGLDIPKDYILKLNGELYRDFHLFKNKEEAESYAETIKDQYESVEVVEKEPFGYNGFQSQLVKWDACPLKDEEWAKSEIKKVGIDNFSREYNCMCGNNLVKIMDEKGYIRNVSLENLYNFY